MHAPRLSVMSIPSSHISSVDGIPSSQSTGTPSWQPANASHTSAPSHHKPFWQAASSGEWVIVSVASSHASTVHQTPSSNAGEVPSRHSPVSRLHVSSPLQYRLSSQSASDAQLPVSMVKL